MKNILFNNFESIFSIESFLIEINCKMKTQDDRDKLQSILKQLSSIVIAFDFKFKGPFQSYIDTRYSYEQLLLLVCLKLKESKLFDHENHMFLTNLKQYNSGFNNLKLSQLNNTNLEDILLSSDNLSICYFLSKDDDGKYWRELHSLVGSSILKYLLLYSYMFRGVKDARNSCIQICGCKLIASYKTLVERKLVNKKADTNFDSNKPEEIKPIAKISLKTVFEKREEELLNELNEKKTAAYQIKLFGHSFLDKTSLLYSRNLGMKISNKFIYSNLKMEVNEESANRIMNQFILKNINFELYPNDKQDIVEMKQNLCQILISFMNSCRSCPYRIFLNCFCKNSANDTEDKSLLSKHVESKSVYCFVRRCLMHVLDYRDKIEKYDNSCKLLGGKLNFKHTIKHIRKILSSLKYDKFTLNTLIHGIKFARINYLKSIKCHQFKTLILLAVLRWLFEDFIFKLVKSSFYATDTSKTNSAIFFYLKTDWKNILKNQLIDQTTKNYKYLYQLERIKEINAIEYCSRYESNGYSLGRLLPKNVQNECRIISGCRTFNPYKNKLYSTNYKFITLNKCLDWFVKKDPTLVGFSSAGPVEIRKKYLNFLNLNSLNRNSTNNLKQWNFLKADIQKCYDSIDIDELIGYMDELFEKYLGEGKAFTVIKFALVEWDIDQKNLKLKYDHLAVRHANYEKCFKYGSATFRRVIENKSFGKFNKDKTQINHIFVPIVIHDMNINLKKLKESLRMCMKHVLIKIHDEIFERTNGILQGSICSRNLCDFYFGKKEKKLFAYQDQATSNDSKLMILNRANDLIMRLVDDYLVICSDMIRLIQIYNLIKREFDLNESKTVVYFWTSNNIADNNLNKNSEFNFLASYSNQFFSWCGLDFDVNTLDVYFNYEKYFDLNNMKTRLNSSNDYRFAFVTFNLKFSRLFNLNTNSLVFDSRINSIQAILRNFIDCFSLSSIRFYLLYNLMPSQIRNDLNLQFKLIANLCYLSDNKINFNLRNQLLEFFYSTFTLFKYLCFNVYILLLERLNLKLFKRLINFLKKKISNLNFLNCFKSIKSDVDLTQIDDLIKHQISKFNNCK